MGGERPWLSTKAIGVLFCSFIISLGAILSLVIYLSFLRGGYGAGMEYRVLGFTMSANPEQPSPKRDNFLSSGMGEKYAPETQLEQ